MGGEEEQVGGGAGDGGVEARGAAAGAGAEGVLDGEGAAGALASRKGS